jgi:hypothetical protein
MRFIYLLAIFLLSISNVWAARNDVMKLCTVSESVNFATKAIDSSDYCSYGGRYVVKAFWNANEDDTSSGALISGKVITPVSLYSVAREAMKLASETSAYDYRLPTINELLSLVDFGGMPSSEVFGGNHIINNWFKKDDGAGAGAGALLDGYVVSSTFKTVSGVQQVMALDLQSRKIVALNPLLTYPTTPSGVAPNNKPLYVLGVSDYFQIISSYENNLCVQYNTHDTVLILAACDKTELKQRWRYLESGGEHRLRNQSHDGGANGWVCYNKGVAADTFAKGYSCGGAGGNHSDFRLVVDGSIGTTIVYDELLKIKANNSAKYLTNNNSDLETIAEIGGGGETSRQFWIFQY